MADSSFTVSGKIEVDSKDVDAAEQGVVALNKNVKNLDKIKVDTKPITKLGTEAGKAGKQMTTMGKLTDNALKLIKKGAQDAGDAVEGMGGGVLVAVAAIAGLASGIGAAFMQNEKFAKSFDNFKTTAAGAFSFVLKPASNFFAKILDGFTKSIKGSQDLEVELGKLGNSLSGSASANLEELDQINAAIDAQKDKIAELETENDELSATTGFTSMDGDIEAANAELDKLIEKQKSLTDATKGFTKDSAAAYDKYTEAIKNANSLESSGAISVQQANDKKTAAAIDYEKALEQQYDAAVKAQGADSAAARDIADKVKQTNAFIASLNNAVEAQSALNEVSGKGMTIKEQQEKIWKDYLAAIKDAQNIEVREAAEGIDAQTAHADALRALSQAADTAAKATQGLGLKSSKAFDVYTKAGRKANDELATMQKTSAKIGTTDTQNNEAQSAFLEQVTALQEDLDTKKQKALVDYNQGVLTQNQYQNQIAAYSKTTADALKAMTVPATATREEMEGWNDALADAQQNLKEIKPTLQEVGAAVTQAAGSIAQTAVGIMGDQTDAEIDKINQQLEDENDVIDEWLDEQNEQLEEQREAALEAAGFVEATTEEGQAAAMEAALETGDEQTIYNEQQRQKQLAINKEYDDKEAAAQKAADDQKQAAAKAAAQKSADLQYKQAMAEYLLNVAQAGVNMATAISKAVAENPPPIGLPMIALASATAAAALAAVIAKTPQKPAVTFAQGGAFADGGVVNRPTKFKFAQGDSMTNAVAGEAGAEAILPLTRMTNGDLGVQAAGASTENQLTTIAIGDLFNLFVKAYNGNALTGRLALQ